MFQPDSLPYFRILGGQRNISNSTKVPTVSIKERAPSRLIKFLMANLPGIAAGGSQRRGSAIPYPQHAGFLWVNDVNCLERRALCSARNQHVGKGHRGKFSPRTPAR